MTLRATLILWMGVVLAVSLAAGSAMTYWHAIEKVDVEMRAAMAVGEHTVHNAMDDAEEVAAPLRQLQLLVGDLDGDRHLRATLIAPDGKVIARSTPLPPEQSTPQWFFNLLGSKPLTARMQLPTPFGSIGTLLLETDPHNEIGEVWSDVMLTLGVLTLFCISIAVLVFCSTGTVLRPLKDALVAFERIGGGDYGLRLPERGPLELRQLSHGFNQMAKRLFDSEVRKHRLEEQLEAVQEEERRELSQDLHDEIGPLLFAASVDLAAIKQAAALREEPALNERLLAMGDAISRMQYQVKTILGRLRPPTVADLGLGHSIQRLVHFWHSRYPGITFEVDTPEDPVPADVGSSIYRLIQESISNALRHGQPTRIEIRVVIVPDGSINVTVTDDGKGLPCQDLASGLGLTGMRSRVETLGGALTISSAPGGRGVEVFARLPLPEQNP